MQVDSKKTIKLSRQLSDLVAYTQSSAFKGLDIAENGMLYEEWSKRWFKVKIHDLISIVNRRSVPRGNSLLGGGLTICTPWGQRCSLISHVYEELGDFTGAKLQLIYYSKRAERYISWVIVRGFPRLSLECGWVCVHITLEWPFALKVGIKRTLVTGYLKQCYWRFLIPPLLPSVEHFFRGCRERYR